MDDDYAASRSNLEKLIKEIQCIKECLTCRICLEFFKEPVTLKCGHKFCKKCILRVVANDKPKCSFCKIKIQKRSIPKEGNETLISVIESFKTLVNAVNDDLGINVLEPCNQVKHSKESALVHKQPCTLELEEAGASEESTENKILKSQAENTNRLSLRKKKVTKNNNLFNYVQESSESESNQPSHEKVENWLKSNSQHVDGIQEEPKYKETQLRIQEIEMLAKKKKLNQSVVDKALLKTPSVPAASHSDTWSRVKRVGKEMQAKTFKSLSVSVEKSSTTIVLDDTVPYDSINNDTKNDSEEVILRNNAPDKISLSEAKQKVSTKNVSKDYICKNLSTDSSSSHKDTPSLSCVDQKQINEIIGISTAQNNLHTPERPRDLCISNQENLLSPLKVIVDVHRENEISDDESTRSKLKISQKECISTKTHSPERSKSRLSLRSSVKISNYSSNETKSPRKRPLITFKKLGKICKRSKKIPFLKLGKIKPEGKLLLKASGIVVKSDLTVNVNYKQLIANHENTIVSIASADTEDKILPCENNSQSKILSIEPHQNNAEEFNSNRHSKTYEINNSCVSNVSKTSSKISKKPKMSNLLMDIEESKEEIDHEISNHVSSSPGKTKHKEVTSEKEEFNSSRHSKTSETDNSCLSHVSKTSSKISKKPKMSNLLMDIEKSNEEIDCEISSNNSLSPVKIKPKEVTFEKEKFNSSKHSKTSETDNSCLSNVSKTRSKILKKPKMSNLLMDIEKSNEEIDCEISSNNSLSPVKIKPKEVTFEKEKFNSSKLSKTSETDNSCLSNVSKTRSKILKKPKMSNLLMDIEKSNEEIDCEISSNNSLSPVKIKPKEVTSEKEKFNSSRHSKTSETDNSCLSNVSKTRSKILKKPKMSNLLMDIEKSNEEIDCEMSSNNSLSPVKIKPKEVTSEQEEIVSVSSNESESDNFTPNIKTGFQNHDSFQEENKSRNSEEMQCNVDSDSSIASLNNNKKKRKEKFISSSASSSAMGSPIKRKRTHSESSESTDDVLSIIDKWCESDGVKDQIKKPKRSSSFQKQLDKDKNQSKHSEDFVSNENDCTLVESDFKKSEKLNFKTDSPISNIINEVKSFKEYEANVNLMNIPSSLMSADLFESNEHCAQLHPHLSSKQLDKSMNSHSSVSTWHAGKTIQKENLNLDQSIADVTIVDTSQFNRKKSNSSESLDGSNKENKRLVENVAVTKTTDHVAYESEEQNFSNVKCKITTEKSVMNLEDSCHMSDSSMDITQREIALKKIEKDLFGADLSIAPESKLQEKHEDRFSTPRRQIKRSHTDINEINENEFDPDNIGATPVTRKRQPFSFPMTKINELEKTVTTPDKSSNLIPAITPMRYTKSYPVGHSTPMVDTSSGQNKSFSKSKKITLICTGLSPENIKIVLMFSKKFKATFQNNFSADVTHVIVKTDPLTKGGKKTFKYIQGVAFQKYVVDYQWIVDCLTQNTLLDEDDEKYDVLDPETLEPGAKRSRMRTQDLFEKFAFFCCEPISNILLHEFKSLLAFNGAVVANTVAELATQNDKFKIILLESESLSQNKILSLKDSKQVLVSFEWVVDSISQYDILSLYTYLFNTTVEEALALGFPPDILVEEETVEEDEEEQEET